MFKDFYHTGLQVGRSQIQEAVRAMRMTLSNNRTKNNGNGIYYVNGSIAASGDGTSWQEAKKTIGEAVAIATTRNDTIFIAPGDYDEAATLNLTTQGLKLIGADYSNPFQNKVMLYDGTQAGYDILTINNHEIVIDGLAISAAVDTYDGIKVGTTTPCYKVTIQNCRLDGWSGEYGVQAGDLNDCPDLAILNNLFRSWNTSACYMNVTRGAVIGNYFHVVTDKNGIEHIPVGGNRPDNMYLNNHFSGVSNASTTGIKMTGAPNNGTCMIGGNMFYGTFDTAITKIAAHAGNRNFISDNAGGNSLVDTVT